MRIFVLTLLAMIAFAGNSLFCRLALKNTNIDPASFTSLRIISGAIVLWLIVQLRGGQNRSSGDWISALALFAYAAGFSFAYVSLPAGMGALLLFGAVQATMIGFGLWAGERLQTRQILALLIAVSGMVVLFLPGLSTPSLHGSILMLVAGISWGVYSLLGRGTGDPLNVTAGNFFRAFVFSAGLSLATLSGASTDSLGFVYAILSGVLASGVGYVVWYAALRGLKASSAATVQLSVPVLAAGGGVLFLSEPITLRLLFSSIAILGGVALFIYEKQANK